MGLVVVTPPAEEPVDIAAAMAHCRAADGDEATVGTMVQAAREVVSNLAQRTLTTTAYRYTLDRFPAGPVRLPLPPLVGVTAARYRAYDTEVLTAIDEDVYAVDVSHEPGLIRLLPNQVWPYTARLADAVSVEYTAGYGGPPAVPAALKLACLMLVGFWYENRSTVVVGATSKELELSVKALCGTVAYGRYA